MHENIAQHFAEHGYYHARHVFTGDTLTRLQRSFDDIVAQLQESGEDIDARWQSAVERLDAGKRRIIHTHQVQCYDACWLQALLSPAFSELAVALLGEDVVLHHSKLFYKPARTGGPFPLHQDWAYFPTLRDTMLAGVIHLSEADPDNGCLRVVPGSHTLGRHRGLSGNAGHHDGEDLEFLSRYRLEDAVPVICEPGDVVFFHYFTLHGSGCNDSDRSRKTVLTQLHAGDDAVEDPTGHANARLPIAGRNRTMRRSMAHAST